MKWRGKNEKGAILYVHTARHDNAAGAVGDFLNAFDIQPVHVFGIGWHGICSGELILSLLSARV
jgi:hypothetical protein